MNLRPAMLGLMLIAVAAVAAGSAAAEGPLVTVDLAKISADRVVADAVSEPQSLDGVACRVVRKGQVCAIAVDRWWGQTPQPPAGAIYLAAVRYKDTVEEPVRFLSYAGLGRYEGPSEMHRFGGLADGKWKLARVPLAWDMLLSLPSDKGRVRLAIQSPAGDLPVASITISRADADAERRYNAETRQWVRRVQSRLKPSVEVPPQTPVIPPALAGAPIVPYVRSYMSVIYPYSAPQAGEAGATVRVRMALNEYEPAAFGVYAAKDKLTGVTFEVSGLTGPAGRLAVEIKRGTVEYCLHSPGRKDTQLIQAERIWPAYPVEIDQGKSHWFWITLKTDPDKSKPGTYTGTITIRADQGRATLPIEVEVLPIKLLTMDEAGLLMGGCTVALVPQHEMKILRQHNFNMINIWYPGVAPRMRIRNGKMELDFEWIDHWMRIARKYDMGPLVWFLGGNPYEYPRTLSIEREIYIALHEGEKPRKELYDEFTRIAGTEAHRGRTLPEVEPYYREWIRRVWRHAKENNWPEIIFTPFDEPASWAQGPYRISRGVKNPHIIGAGPWTKDHFKYACKLIHESAPGVRIYASIHHNHLKPPKPGRPIREGQVFLEDVEVFCTNAIDEDPALGEKVRAAGKQFWQYKGIGSGRHPDQTRFTFGFFFSAFDSRGSLVWAYDWGRGFDTSSGYNWMIAWRTPFDVIGSPCFEAMREAWDDRRYVETLKAVAAQKKADISAFLAKLAEDAIRLRGSGGRKVVYDTWGQAKDLDAIDGMRQRIAAKILELQQ